MGPGFKNNTSTWNNPYICNMNKLENFIHVHKQYIVVLMKDPIGLKQVFMASQRSKNTVI